MPEVISVSKAEFPFKTEQNKLKEFAKDIFGPEYKDIDRILESYDNAEIISRNLSVPVEYFYQKKSFREKNDQFIKFTIDYSTGVIKESILKSGIDKNDITDFIFVSSTGISTPSPDALLINEMKLNPYINRTPVWGLGCAGGVSGIAKASVIAKANPKAVVLLLAVELCSLTFIRSDLSKSNLIAAGLFSDGIASVIITGDEYALKGNLNSKIKITDSQSRLYYDSIDVMGWEVIDSGFKVIFSKDIPAIVNRNVKQDIEIFLKKNNLRIEDIQNYVVHPGGKKVIDAYVNALSIKPEMLNNTRRVLRENGNMSSSTALYVLNEFIDSGFEDGYGLMMSLGPGFSSEMVLLEMKNL